MGQETHVPEQQVSASEGHLCPHTPAVKVVEPGIDTLPAAEGLTDRAGAGGIRLIGYLADLAARAIRIAAAAVRQPAAGAAPHAAAGLGRRSGRRARRAAGQAAARAAAKALTAVAAAGGLAAAASASAGYFSAQVPARQQKQTEAKSDLRRDSSYPHYVPLYD